MSRIKKLTDREHILLRPDMFIGGVKEIEEELHIWNKEQNKFEKRKVKYHPGLVKIFNEIIDNAVDEAIETNFKICNKIQIELNDNYFIVQDNGRGIPVKKGTDNILQPELAWGHPRAGSSFDMTERKLLKMNGYGAYLTNVFSKKFIGETYDSEKCFKGTWEDNASKFKYRVTDTKRHGTKIISYPDFEKFKTDKFNEDEKEIIYSRIVMLKLTYPEINFIFNRQKIQIKDFDF